MNTFNSKNGLFWISRCGVCGEPLALDEDVCEQPLDIITKDTVTHVSVFFHPKCAAEFYRRYPNTKKEGAE